MGFKKIESDTSVYIYTNGEVKMFVPIYIDDITIASKSTPAIECTVSYLLTSNAVTLDLLSICLVLVSAEIALSVSLHFISASSSWIC